MPNTPEIQASIDAFHEYHKPKRDAIKAFDEAWKALETVGLVPTFKMYTDADGSSTWVTLSLGLKDSNHRYIKYGVKFDSDGNIVNLQDLIS